MRTETSTCDRGKRSSRNFLRLVSGKSGLPSGCVRARRGSHIRQKTVEAFWKNGVLDPDSNVQFGEGGAGTFSDGKLNTLVKDPSGRNHEVLKRFVQAGAPEEIIYQQKPHLGTDVLVGSCGDFAP